MNKRLASRIAIIALLVIFGYFQKDRIAGGGTPRASPSPAPATATPELRTERNAPSPNLVMKNMEIRDVDGSIAYRGDVDLAPTLKRIKAEKRDSHANDGAIFGNRERRIPLKERDYYREYVVRTPGINHAGPQRIIIGKKGETYYTHDHYQSFRKIEP